MVKIVKYSKDNCWYKDRVGEVFEVNNYKFDDDYYEIENRYNCIYKVDAIPVNEIKYEYRGINIITKCPAGFSQMVGSATCDRCEYSCGSNTKSRIVLCSWQKEEEDKMDLKAIAVRFENMEQREEIELIFENSGLQLTEGLDEYRNGVLGYIESGKYVSILTEYGMIGKKIISYEEFIGGKDMKRLDIGKEYEDDMITIRLYAQHVYICIGCMAELRVGEDEHRLNLSQANAILKVLGLPYELVDESVNWGKVKEGANVLFLYKKGIVDRYKGKFLKYIPDIKKVIVRIGDEVKVVDEDTVGLDK